ncbi:MAG: glycosyltransferase [Lachnospiraceae bacterium]|nr:glycosyltransferase [Lachnospiraceae bacterium]
MADGRMLSVIVPVYKVQLEYLSECFESILGQTFSDFELIIVDDGAGDEIASYIDAYDYKGADVKIIHQENAGVAAARNRGLRECTGTYVTFIDSDDTVSSDCFEQIAGFAEKNGLEVLMFGIYRQYSDHRTEFSPYVQDLPHFSGEQLEEVKFKCMVGILPFYVCPPASADAAGSACAKLYRLDFLNKKGLRYKTGLERAEDMEFNLRVFDAAEHAGYLHRFFYNYRQIATSATYVYRPGGIKVFTASLLAMKDYLLSAKKPELYMQVFYMRCMFFFLESMNMDYLNKENPKKFRERIRELAAKASEEPYAQAFEKLSGEHLTFARKIPLFLIRHRMFTALALFYSVYRTVMDHNG